MMIPAFNRKDWLRGFGALLGVVILVGSTEITRSLEVEEDDMPDVKLFRGLMGALGVNKNQAPDYRERSPLVVPPSRDLPPPAAISTEKNPAWPKDPDVLRSKQAKAERNAPKRMEEALERARPMRPNELRPTGTTTGSAARSPGDNRIIDHSAPMRPNELGYKGGMFQSLFNPGKEEEYATFTGEQPRTSLIEPPASYRTPSPTQPYGAGKEKWSPIPVDRLIPTR